MSEATALIDSIVNGESQMSDFVKGMYSYENIYNKNGYYSKSDCILEINGKLYRAILNVEENNISVESAQMVNEVDDMAKCFLMMMNNEQTSDIEVIEVNEDYTIIKYNNNTYIVRNIFFYCNDDYNYDKTYIDYYNEDDNIDKNPGNFIGDGTEENPYLVQSIEDLVAFSENTNDHSYSNKQIALDKDLDFNDDNSYVNPNTLQFGDVNKNNIIEPLKIELTTASGFKPISSNDYYFDGTFDGKNHMIKNLYMNSDNYDDFAFFSRVGGEIKNLKVSGNVTGSGENIGGIVSGLWRGNY